MSGRCRFGRRPHRRWYVVASQRRLAGNIRNRRELSALSTARHRRLAVVPMGADLARYRLL